MKFVEFEQANNTIAKDQPGYLPIPVYENSRIPGHPHVMCLELDPVEREQFLKTGKLYLTLYLAAMPAFHPIHNTMLNTVEHNLLEPEQQTAQERLIEVTEAFKKVAFLSGADKIQMQALMQIIAQQGYATKRELLQVEYLNIPIIAEIAALKKISIPAVSIYAGEKKILSSDIVEAILNMVAPGGVFYE